MGGWPCIGGCPCIEGRCACMFAAVAVNGRDSAVLLLSRPATDGGPLGARVDGANDAWPWKEGAMD